MKVKTFKKVLFPCLIISLILNIFFLLLQTQSVWNERSDNYSIMYHHLDSLLLENFYKKYESGERIAVYFGRPSCLDCDNVDDILVDFIHKHNLEDEIKYVNIEKEYRKGKKEWIKFKKSVHISGTPTFAIYDRQKLVSKYDFEDNGGFSIERFEIWLQVNELIK